MKQIKKSTETSPTIFSQKVYSLCKKIPKGKVSTYKLIAEKLGIKAYRAVGQSLKCNPYAPIVPCHRVVSSDGSLGGFNGEMNSKKKINLLKKEGITAWKLQNGKFKIKNFEKKIFRF